MTRRLLLLLPLALVFASTESLTGTDAAISKAYHVATTGSDASPGTQSKPFRTIQRAVNAVEPGDSLVVHGGTYREIVTIRKSGTATRRIRLLAAGDGEVVISPSLPAVSCSSSSPTRDRAIQILGGSDNWTIRGVTIVGGILISGSNSAPLDAYTHDRTLPGRGVYDPVVAGKLLGLLGSDGADYIGIAENRIRGRGILTNAARYGRIRANEIYNIDCGTGAAIWISRFSDGWWVFDNHIHDVPPSEHHPMSEGIRQGSASCYNLIENNLIEDLEANGRGISTDVLSSWNVIRDNLVRRAKQGINEQTGGWGNEWIGNRVEDVREYGFNVNGKDGKLPEPDNGVPAMMVARCNVVVRAGLAALSIGAVQEADFAKNAFPTVDLSSGVETYWTEEGNTWDGSSEPPPENPPLKYCGEGEKGTTSAAGRETDFQE